MPVLPHERKGNPTLEDSILPQPGQDRDLVDAAYDFRRVLPANGEIDGQEDYLDRSEQFAKLRYNHGIGDEDSYAFVGEETAVFDMRPANVFMTAEGLLIAVDSIPVRLTDENRAI